MTTTFISRPRPYRDEALESYLLRLALENTSTGYKDFSNDVTYSAELASETTDSYQGSFNKLSSVNFYLEHQPKVKRITLLSHLAKMVKLDPVDLETLGFHRSEVKSGLGHRLIQIDDWLIPRCLFRTKGIPICIECLKQNTYARKLWHLLAYRHCHKHDIALTENCPRCMQILDYRESESFHRCQCGLDLLASSDKKQKISITLFDDIEKKLNSDNLLVSQSYQDRLKLLVWYLYRFDTQLQEGIQDLPVDKIQAAEHYFQHWPLRFIDELKERASNAEYFTDRKINETPFNQVFGNIILNSRLTEKREANQPILDALRQFIYQLIEDNPLTKKPNSADLLMNIEEIATLKNLSNNDIFKAFEQGRLTPKYQLKSNQSLDVFHCLFSLRQIATLPN